MPKGKLSHVDARGEARMVDVGAKEVTRRRASATGRVRFSAEAFGLLRANRLAKGDALAVARLAGLAAGKRTAEWIPLCHAVPLDHLEVRIALAPKTRSAEIVATATARWVTGVEMEALVAVAGAALALYDMAKGVDRGITIEGIALLEKTGGRSGRWVRPENRRKGLVR